MKPTILIGLLSLFVLGGMGISALAEDEEALLKQEEQKINSTVMPTENEQDRINALAREFNVTTDRVRSLRNQKLGWGEVTIDLAMAKQLSATSKEPLTMDQALTKIQVFRDQKMGWGRIAKENGFKLGPIVGDVKSSERSIQAADLKSKRHQEQKAQRRYDRPQDRPDRSFDHPAPQPRSHEPRGYEPRGGGHTKSR